MKTGRNQPCPCGSGKKFKKCHGSAANQSVVAEVSKVGNQWVQRHLDTLFELAQGELNPSRLIAYTQLIDEGDGEHLDQTMAKLSGLAKTRAERELLSELSDSLKISHLEPVEVTEVRRGYGVRVRGCFTHISSYVEQPEDAGLLEPMEWIIARLISFKGKSYLLPAWEKVPFRKRKTLKRAVYAYLETHPDETSEVSVAPTDEVDHPDELMSSEGDLADRVKKQTLALTSAWFKTHATWLLEQREEVKSL